MKKGARISPPRLSGMNSLFLPYSITATVTGKTTVLITYGWYVPCVIRNCRPAVARTRVGFRTQVNEATKLRIATVAETRTSFRKESAQPLHSADWASTSRPTMKHLNRLVELTRIANFLVAKKRRIQYNLRMSDSRLSSDERQKGALLIAASLIAAIRLRGEPIDNSPKTVGTVHDSIKLARIVLQRILSN